MAADLKRVMREKARLGEKTFALTADIAEAHRQIPIHPRDWHLLGCQTEVGGDVYTSRVGTFGVASASCYWSRSLRNRQTDTVPHVKKRQHVAPVSGR